jgi:hypothetical protein
MKNILLLSFVFSTIAILTNAQQAELIGKWQLSKVVVDDEKGGVLKAARSAQSEVIEAGKWELNEKQNTIIMSSTLDEDFNGTATLVNISKTELIYKKDNAILHFNRMPASNVVSDVESEKVESTITRLEFTEADFFNNDGDYKYYDDEVKLPWQDINEMLMSLANVKQLVYKFSTLDEDEMGFQDKILIADVNSNPSEQTLSVDYIFYGFDRYNLPEDSELPPNTEYSGLLYPEEENTFRVSGSEQITTLAGTFDCTVVEVVGSFETCKKLWMINDKPGVYAKIIADKPGLFGQYSIYELQEIKMIE